MDNTAAMATDNIVRIARAAAETSVMIRVQHLAGAKNVLLDVCSGVISNASPVFTALASKALTDINRAVSVEDGGESVYLLMCLLHLRTDLLPAKLAAEPLAELAQLAVKYQCAAGISRMTVPWLDRVFNASADGKLVVDTWKAVQTAYLLNEPLYFRHFTDRLVLDSPTHTSLTPTISTIEHIDQQLHTLATQLQDRRVAQLAAVRADLDLLIEPCSAVFSREAKHFVDYAPGMDPDADDEGKVSGSLCHVDEGGATTYLGALRDERIWPLTVWQGNLATTLTRLRQFRVPEYDDCDKCEFCENIRERFTNVLELVKHMHKERLWGLCLDCFMAGGVNPGECRVEHPKIVKT
ncbi:hypothetical protein LTR78_007159 [Recurvomyces mirabilis]|uniref:BTB domain-containing protein n=1 Tax=Recurvomyces mirabilis TaxID=574656 RepID=A0AAE0WJW6_9PEZI|nr:hypothetical protein LTR78_007159 [Recurvomyces mirabilis]KAK5150869.1 hypothetical protein LTS14_009672 [Recurvomyces mirabilis]